MITDNKNILDAVKKAHQDSYKALNDKDLKLYLDVFSESLQYIQANGKTINKAQLLKETALSFHRIHSVEHHYTQDSYFIEGDLFVEAIIQDSSVYMGTYIFFLAKWNVKRKGIYTWKNEQGKWKIISVEILEEKTKKENGLWFFTKKRLV